MTFLRTKWTLAAAVFALGSSANAATQLVYSDFADIAVGRIEPQFERFDPNLGTLTGVSISFTSTYYARYSSNSFNLDPNEPQGPSTTELSIGGSTTLSVAGKQYQVELEPFSRTIVGSSMAFFADIGPTEGSGVFALAPQDFTPFVGTGYLAGSVRSAAGASVYVYGPDDFYTFEVYDPGATGFIYVTYTYAEAVPEPETWAMMLVGFGLVGAVARRREALAQPA